MTLLSPYAERGASPSVGPAEPRGIVGALTSSDHKVIGLLTVGTAMVFFFVFGLMAITMRIQLAQPDQSLVPTHLYNELFTIHGSGMIYMTITPLAVGFGVYLVPLQIGSPRVAAPRVALTGYWLYVLGAITMLFGFGTGGGAAPDGWYAYPPLTDRLYTPGQGMDLWIVGAFLATSGMILMGACTLWTALQMRCPGMALLRMPIFCWSTIVADMMIVGSFPVLLVALSLQAAGRMDPSIFSHNYWNIGYQNLFWFYGHPVVYVMFFPFVGMVEEVLAVFAGRAYVAYKATVLAQLAFAGLSMSVWGHHMFTTGQSTNDYYSFTSLCLSMPAGIEYFGFLGTILGGRLVYRTPMLFALAFIPQFLVGGLTGIMVGTPVLDYMFHGSFFVVAHFHYTLFAGSVFGLFAGFYLWFPKATGVMLSDRLGKVHFWLMVIGTNMTFGPMFAVGFMGMSRRVATYPKSYGIGTLNLVESIGAGIILISMLVFVANLFVSWRRQVEAGPDPWGGHSLEWATSSPPPPHNFTSIPPITSYAPLHDLHLAERRREMEEERQRRAHETAGAGAGE